MSMTKMECAVDSLQAAAEDNPEEFQYYLNAIRAGDQALGYLQLLWDCHIEDLSNHNLDGIRKLLKEWN